MKHKILDNTVIRCTSPEQGQKIRAFFLLCGVDEEEMQWIKFKEPIFYYGFFNGEFRCLSESVIKRHNLRIVELPSEEFLANNLGLPCKMEVWDTTPDFNITRRIVAYRSNSSHSWIDDCGNVWQNAKHIPPKKEKKTISIEELFEKAGLSAEDYIIE
jgi:hypothetical protein